MAIEITDIKLHGLDELRRKLEKIPADIERKAMRKGARAAGLVIQEEAKARAPRRTGKLQKNINLVVRKRRDGRISALVGLGSDAFYGKFLERGHRHIGRGKGRRAKLRRGTIQGKRIPAKPFMEPAFDAKAEAALAEFERAVIEYVDSL